MKNPKYIIEISKDISQKKQELIVEQLESLLNCTVNIYSSEYYAFESEFSNEIFKEIKKELEYEALE